VVKGHTGQDDARFTSKAKIEATQTNVRFVPIADIRLQSMPHYNVYVQLTFRAQARSYSGW
jgi:hypothetical protein